MIGRTRNRPAPDLPGRRPVITALAIAAALAAVLVVRSQAGGSEAARAPLPNIVFFLVDDMGWVDTTVNGSTYYETPNMERLARRGVTFTNAYSASAVCSPTRASIMSGQYPARLHFYAAAGHRPPRAAGLKKSAKPNEKVVTPRSASFLPLDVVTIAEALKPKGYVSELIGKWHLGRESYWPNRQGFDVQIAGGEHAGPKSYFSPYRVKNLPPGPEGEYITDRLTDEAVAFLQANRDGPFMLHLWHYGVHGPWGAKEEVTATFEDKSDPRGLQSSPVMASMLKSVDDSLGRILDTLEALGIADTTIVVFTSDNGGNVHTRIGGHVVTNNAPLKGGKGMIHEGGIRVPLIVSWPGLTSLGAISDMPVSSTDFYPTLLEAARAGAPAGQPLDGVSLVPALAGERTDRRPLFFYEPNYSAFRYPSAAVRLGDWKLVRRFGDGPDGRHKHQLYDLSADIGEANDLAASRPEIVGELAELLDDFLERTGAILPVANPSYDPAAPVPEFTYKEARGQTRASMAK